MKTEKILIGFRSGSSAFERNQHIRLELEKRCFAEVIRGVLIRADGTQTERIYENRELEEAVSIEVYYKCSSPNIPDS